MVAAAYPGQELHVIRDNYANRKHAEFQASAGWQCYCRRVTTSEKEQDGMRPEVISEQYFAAPGTVASWWDPLSENDQRFREYLLAQQDDLLVRCDVQGKRVLDCCTGRGRMAIAAAAHGALSVTGIDISDEMLELARANAASAGVAIDFRIDSTAAIDMPCESVDLVYCLEALLHLDDPWQALAEFHRVLRRGGTVILTTNGANPLARLTQPSRKGTHPAGRIALACVTAINEVMTAILGFTWRRTRATGWLYWKLFRVPVRPLYRRQVAGKLATIGFVVQQRAIRSGPFVREIRWFARKR